MGGTTDFPGPGGPVATGWRRVVVILAVGLVWCTATAVLGHAVYPDPFSWWGQAFPLLVLAVLAVVAMPLVLRGRDRGADVAALLVAGWVSWFGATQLHGTPFPYGGMRADIARLTAAATKFSVHADSTDLLFKGLPIEYPPLFPWLVGRLSAVLGVPAWELMAPASVVFCGLAVLSGYLLWRALVTPALALALCIVPAAVYGDPRKAHEVAAVCVLTPWVLGGLARYRRSTPPLHWAVTGLVGGLLVTDYQGYLVFSLVGILVVVALGLRERASRTAYLRHLVLATVTALVTAAWFLWPWLSVLVRTGGDDSADTFVPFEATTDPLHLPWQQPWPMAGWLCAGLALTAYHAWRHAWARHLLALTLATMGYRVVMLRRFEETGHTAFFQYTDRLSDGLLVIGAVLSVVALWPRLLAAGPSLRRLRPHARRVVGGLAAIAVVVTSAGFYWAGQRAGAAEDEHSPNFARLAHATELPGGGYPEFNAEAGQLARFPAVEVQRIIEEQLGRGAVPTVLTYDESLSSYYPYYQYLGVGGNSANSLGFWPRRETEVWALSGQLDPRAFAAASASMPHGPIDVFVLRGQSRWFEWRDLHFVKGQFAEPYFHTELAAGNTWVFVRRGATVEHADYPR